MKTLKKALAIVMAALMAAVILPVFASAAASPVLKFGDDGKFEIMIFSDSQDDENLEETTTQLMIEALDAYQPDLVVYLGDNTVANGYENQYKAIEAIVTPCVERDVPYAIVFGNHDQEQGVEKEVLLSVYQQFGCLTYDADPEMYGCGNCNLPILSSNGTKIAFNLWFIDSGSSNFEEGSSGYDYVRESQIEWYKETAAKLALLNGGETVPAINFQHIVPVETYDALGMVQLPIGIKDWTYGGQAYLPIPSFSSHTGFVFEPPCPSYTNGGQVDAWLETGDIIASFHGHDHTNTFTTNYEGIDITTVPTVGCNSYSTDITRGVGLITLNEEDLSTYEYEVLNIFDFALAEGSKILDCEGANSKIGYTFMKLINELLTKIHEMIGSFSLPF